MWIERDRRNNSLVVLIHGITGHPLATWDGFLTVLQSYAETRNFLNSWDIYAFGYPTSRVYGQPRLVDSPLTQLRGFIGDQTRYDTVALVCHSQGGLLAKHFVLEELENRNGLDLKIDLIVTYGTPHQGFRRLRPLRAVSSGLQRTPLRSLNVFSQWADLAANSELTSGFGERWTRHILSKPASPTTTRRYIRSIAVVGDGDAVVDAHRAGGFPPDIQENVGSNHRRMVKPGSMSSPEAQVLARQLGSGHPRHPTEVLAEIQRIRRSEEETRLFLESCATGVAGIVADSRRTMNEAALTATTGALATDFLYDFESRVLRGDFDLYELVCKFAERRMANP